MAKHLTVAENIFLGRYPQTRLGIVDWKTMFAQATTFALSAFGALAIFVGVIWWFFAGLWLKFPDFGSHHEGWARAIKLASGTLAVIPAWCALAVIHGVGEAVVRIRITQPLRGLAFQLPFDGGVRAARERVLQFPDEGVEEGAPWRTIRGRYLSST